MASETLPIAPARFAEAIKDLSLSSLHLKVNELRNSIVHLDYSNEQLKPFAEGTQPVLGSGSSTGPETTAAEPDQDCIDAIRENEAVIDRMQERIRLVRAEVEFRGASWEEFKSKEELDRAAGSEVNSTPINSDLVNGNANTEERMSAPPAPSQRPQPSSSGSNPWLDGTFQTGTIRNGEVQMDDVPGASLGRPNGANGVNGTSSGGSGGSLSDEQLRRALEERLHTDHEDQEGNDDGGLHL